MDDILSGMVDREQESANWQLPVYVGLPRLLQWNLGCYPSSVACSVVAGNTIHKAGQANQNRRERDHNLC